MRFEKLRIRDLRLSAALAAAIHIMLGGFLLLSPGISRGLLCILLGAGAAGFGLANILSFLQSRDKPACTLRLLSGVIALGFGIFSLLHPPFLMNFLFTVLALLAAIAGVGGIQRALQLRRFGFERWHAALAVSLITVAFALSVVLMPGLYGNLVMMLCGVLLTTGGVCDLLSMHYLRGYGGK